MTKPPALLACPAEMGSTCPAAAGEHARDE